MRLKFIFFLLLVTILGTMSWTALEACDIQKRYDKEDACARSAIPSSRPNNKESSNCQKATDQPYRTTVDDEALKLVERFVDLTDTSLSWQEFATAMAAIFQKEEKYKSLSQAFRDVTNSTFTSYIGYKLSWHKNSFPPKTYAFIKKYSGGEFANITARRIKLNKKTKNS